MNQDNWYKSQIEYYKDKADEQEEGSAYFDFLFEFFEEILSGQKQDAILEIGSNEGRYTLPLLKRGYNITAIDISEEPLCALIEKAKRERVADRLATVKANIENYETSGFDLIFCAQVLHHLYDLENVIGRLYKLLNKSGRVVCLEPNPLNLLWYIHIFLVELQKGGKWGVEKRIIQCTEWNLKRMFCKSGFRQVKIHPFMFFPPQIINRLTSLRKLEPLLSNMPIINKFLSFNIIEAFK